MADSMKFDNFRGTVGSPIDSYYNELDKSVNDLNELDTSISRGLNQVKVSNYFKNKVNSGKLEDALSRSCQITLKKADSNKKYKLR